METHTLVGSKLTRPQARAANPLQLWEMANIPTESGPGFQKIIHYMHQYHEPYLKENLSMEK